MNTITKDDLPIVHSTRLAHYEKVANTYSFKTLSAETNIEAGMVTFTVTAQVYTHVNELMTLHKRYTILETAIAKYNEIQF